MKDKENTKKNVKVWGEHINIFQFIIGLLISVSILLLSLLITNIFVGNNKDVKLIVGLIAVLVGFFTNLIWIKPKRNIVVKEKSNYDN